MELRKQFSIKYTKSFLKVFSDNALGQFAQIAKPGSLTFSVQSRVISHRQVRPQQTCKFYRFYVIFQNKYSKYKLQLLFASLFSLQKPIIFTQYKVAKNETCCESFQSASYFVLYILTNINMYIKEQLVNKNDFVIAGTFFITVLMFKYKFYFGFYIQLKMHDWKKAVTVALSRAP